MKIVHIITTLSSGGAERMVSKICKNDKENEHIIITILKHKPHYEINNSRIIFLNLENNTVNKFLAVKKLIKIVKQLKPDIIQTWMKANFYGPILKKTTNTKIISNFRNGYNGSENRIIIGMFNWYFNFFDENIFVSNSALRERNDKGIKFSKFIVIPNGFTILDSANTKVALKDIFTIGHVGRYHPLKNQQLLLDGFQIFSSDKENVKLYLAGRNLNDSNLDFTSLSLDKVKIFGEIKDVDLFYRKLDLLALVSKSEGFPNVIGEAMSYGVPVVTTDAGESYNIVGESGYKLLHEDKYELAELFEYIYANQKELHTKSIKASKRIQENYSIENTINLYTKTYETVGGLK